jgi:hypothetical protein
VALFPEGSTRDNAQRNLISQWANEDPAAAGKFLQSLPADKSRDQAVQNYINQVSWQYPEMAAPLVNDISEENQRNSYIENIARPWLEIDPKAAQAWLMQTSLSEERKQQLLKKSR